MRKIFCFGNEYVKGDEIAKQIGRQIKNKNFQIIIAESPNEILNADENLIILDVAKGIKKTSIIKNPDNLELSKTLSCHDLDLAFYLKLMQATKKIKEITIIAIPYNENYKEKEIENLKKEIENILNTI